MFNRNSIVITIIVKNMSSVGDINGKYKIMRLGKKFIFKTIQKKLHVQN